jgi:hypothetical protein
MTWIIFECAKISRIAGVGQQVKIDDFAPATADPMKDKVRPNEARAAGD